ncbi:hypothetical protein ACWGF2_37540, partial [Streptomyces sp. NPDC054919]
QHVPGDQRPDETHRAQNPRPRPATGLPTTAVPAATDGTPPPRGVPPPRGCGRSGTGRHDA